MRTRANSASAAALLAMAAATLGGCGKETNQSTTQPKVDIVPIGPLPKLDPQDPKVVELGKMLFFDGRLSGDGAISCATCHNPAKGWGDGMPLSAGYPGALYFRNAKTILNSAHASTFYWDGRLDAGDPDTQVRDSLTEGHFMNMDGRLMLERLKQIPDYAQRFKEAMGGEPSFGRTLKAIAAFEKTIGSAGVPFDEGKLTPTAQRGKALFEGKAGCIQCHHGAYFSDGRPHRLGLPPSPELAKDPLRAITLRSFAKFMGTPSFETLREDPGYFVVSKSPKDRGKFVTPTLRELVHTAPYMHDGSMATLEDVVAFYNKGGGDLPDKDPLLRPLSLSGAESKDLVEFLKSLSGAPVMVEKPALPAYEVSQNWWKTPN
ncbi:MAG: photosynthetic protein synthase I [Deltaproteobacteria bacterium]|nr:photosynthetic protein synthase I [Deltaproteobacteria bacterium]